MFKPDENMQKVKEEGKREEIEDLISLTEKIKGIDTEEVKLPRSTFETYLLPYLLNEIEHNEVNKTVFINNLKDLSGGYKTTLLIVDDIDNDKVLFKLPPLLLDTNIDKLASEKVRNTVVAHDNLKEANPKAADAALNRVKKSILKNMEVDNDKIELYRSYIENFKKFYKNRISKDTTEKSTTTSNNNINNDEDFLNELEF